MDCRVETPLLVPGPELRPADILIHPPTAPVGTVPRPIACDITFVSLFKDDVRIRATRHAGGAAAVVHRNKETDLARTLSRRLPPPSDNPTPAPNFKFQHLAFDSLGTPSPATALFLEGILPRIADKLNTSITIIRTRVRRISNMIWSFLANAIIVRTPAQVGDVVYLVSS